MNKPDFAALNAAIPGPDMQAMAAARARWDNIAKPVGSLGLLEDAVIRLAAIQGREYPLIDKRALIVAAADNGVLAQGVAQTPAAITAVMAALIAQGKSAVGLMAQQAGVDMIVADLGMLTHPDIPGLLDRRIAPGSADMSLGPAMSREQAEQAVAIGMELAQDAAAQGYQIIATGEMGIGNTTTSSAIASMMLAQPVQRMTGRGVGLSDDGLAAKCSAIKRAIAINEPDPADALDVLHKLGGFDIAALTGAFIGGALSRTPMLIDGFISSVAALCAVRLCPNAAYCLLASHASAEPAASLILDELGLHAPIQAAMRLGEGTGAMAVLPLLDMALAVFRELPTFADIGM